jgi:hypothetical protein
MSNLDAKSFIWTIFVNQHLPTYGEMLNMCIMFVHKQTENALITKKYR